MKKLEDLEHCKGGIKLIPPLNGNDMKTFYINESGLYSLIIRSNKSEAKQFKRWITNDVLPSLRKTGSYTINTNILELKNENALHWKVVEYLRKYYPDAILMPDGKNNRPPSPPVTLSQTQPSPPLS